MAEQAVLTDADERQRIAKAELDERRIARGVSYGLPLVTVSTAVLVGLFLGPALAILVLAAGMLLGVISLFWASLRVLSGDASLSPELEALDAGAHAVDALSSRKRMLVRALKDLDNERALGKLEEEDHDALSTTYRAELKEVLRRIDASLEPHRVKAEQAAKEFLVKAGLVAAPAGAYRAGIDHPSAAVTVVAKVHVADAPTAVRVSCPKCETSNEPDASFCKKCGTTLKSEPASDDEAAAAASDSEVADEA